VRDGWVIGNGKGRKGVIYERGKEDKYGGKMTR